jgi:hypothetical protein
MGERYGFPEHYHQYFGLLALIFVFNTKIIFLLYNIDSCYFLSISSLRNFGKRSIRDSLMVMMMILVFTE